MDEARFLKLISQPHPTLDERAMRGMLRVASGFYSFVVLARNFLFDRGLSRSHSVPVPVISIGNLTTGGTGKTPLVAYVVKWFNQRGLQVGIVSRGYRAIGHANDEKLVLARLCPSTPHEQDRNRVLAIERLLAAQHVDIVVADDAFQHRRLKRDLDIVLIDALNPWGYGYLLPRGLLRESQASLRRADLVMMTRADLVDCATRSAIWDEVRRWRPHSEPVEIAFDAGCLKHRDSAGEQAIALDSQTARSQSFFAFCGIGNPAAFEATLQQGGLRIAGLRAFPDHHHYAERDLTELQQAAERTAATAFVATLKDVVKLPRDNIGGRPVWYVDIATRVTAGQAVLDAAFQRIADLNGGADCGFEAS